MTVKNATSKAPRAQGSWNYRPELTQRNGSPSPQKPWISVFEIKQLKPASSNRLWLINFEADYDQSQVGNRYTLEIKDRGKTYNFKYQNRVPAIALDANKNNKLDLDDIINSKRPPATLLDLKRMNPSIQAKLNQFTSLGFSSGTWEIAPKGDTMTLFANNSNSGPFPILAGSIA